MTRTIKGVVLGTYYAAGANAARETPNSSPMRGLIYGVKDNRDPPNRPQLIEHPFHPARRPVSVDRNNAIPYVTAIVSRLRTRLLAFFGADEGLPIILVPVPSSSVTLSSIETARFPALKLCRALAGAGLGSVAVLAVQRRPVEARTQGNRRDAQETFRNLVRTPVSLPRSGALVLVDDNVRSGASIVALDALLGASRPTTVFAVAVTDSQPCADACRPRRFELVYEPSESPLHVRTRAVQPPREPQRSRD